MYQGWQTVTAYRTGNGEVKVHSVDYPSGHDARKAFNRACSVNGPVIEIMLYHKGKVLQVWNKNKTLKGLSNG